MAKASQVANTAITGSLQNGYDSDIDIHVADALSSLSTEWVHYYDRSQHYCDRSKIYRKVDDGLTVGFGFVRKIGDSNKANYAITPEIAVMKKYSDSPSDPTHSFTFDPETHTEYVGHVSGYSEYVFPSPIGPFPYGTENTLQMRYTACEGKNKKAWTVGVVQADKTFEVYSAYVGIDSGGTPYTLAGRAPEFTIWADAITHRRTYPAYPSSNTYFDSVQSQIGFGPNESNLTLIPLVNPFTGATCTDLYIAQGGPRDTMLYDITVNGRHFVTGASLNTEPNEGMTIESYVPEFKIFMEV